MKLCCRARVTCLALSHQLRHKNPRSILAMCHYPCVARFMCPTPNLKVSTLTKNTCHNLKWGFEIHHSNSNSWQANSMLAWRKRLSRKARRSMRERFCLSADKPAGLHQFHDACDAFFYADLVGLEDEVGRGGLFKGGGHAGHLGDFAFVGQAIGAAGVA